MGKGDRKLSSMTKFERFALPISILALVMSVLSLLINNPFLIRKLQLPRLHCEALYHNYDVGRYHFEQGHVTEPKDAWDNHEYDKYTVVFFLKNKGYAAAENVVFSIGTRGFVPHPDPGITYQEARSLPNPPKVGLSTFDVSSSVEISVGNWENLGSDFWYSKGAVPEMKRTPHYAMTIKIPKLPPGKTARVWCTVDETVAEDPEKLGIQFVGTKEYRVPDDVMKRLFLADPKPIAGNDHIRREDLEYNYWSLPRYIYVASLYSKRVPGEVTVTMNNSFSK